MRSSFLRKFRILFASLLLICFFLVFVDFRDLIPAKIMNVLTWFQFIPSTLKFFHLFTIAVTGFAAVILLTIITGRSYCSFLCPLGVLQDVFSRIGGRIRKKFRKYGYKKAFTVIRYTILTATLAVAAIWGIYLLTLLDPYSIFGRFMSHFGKPVVIAVNNLLASTLHIFDIYALNRTGINAFNLLSYLLPLIFLLLIGFLSMKNGRLYCNMICPVGTLLGLFSKLSILRIKFDEDKCTQCGRCAVKCKSSCIDFRKEEVDLTRCVECFNCIGECPEKALSYGLVSLKKQRNQTDLSRRKFVVTSMAVIAGQPLLSQDQPKKSPVPVKASTVKENRTSPVCPPGAGSIKDFNSHCTACSLCISACPNGVLEPALMQYGLTGFMQPVMNYHKSFCTYNCIKCTEVCPTYALHPLLLEAKQLTQIGKAVFITDNCIVKTEETACGACSESCPTKAVYMVPYKGNLLIPETNEEICIGCGHCENACPTVPFKAIFVDGNPVHKAAKKPENIKSEIVKPDDFPF